MIKVVISIRQSIWNSKAIASRVDDDLPQKYNNRHSFSRNYGEARNPDNLAE